MSDRARIVILGGGFAGLGAVEKLKDAPADVVLVDKHTYHTFQPMLYQVATDLVSPGDVGHGLRDLFREQGNVTVRQATTTGIDLDARRVHLAEMAPLEYDYLVIALGAQVNFFGVTGAAEHAFPLYTLPDAVRLKDHILKRWEAADKDPALVADGALNVVVVGGGPTGVESAGAIAELYRGDFATAYPHLNAELARITLVEVGPALLSMFRKDVRTYTQKALEKRGVEVRFGDAVTAVSPTRVTLKSGEVLAAHTLVWGAGLRAHPLARTLGLPLERGDRVPVESDLSLPGRPEVFVVGDIAWITDAKSGEILPQVGGVALQSGEQAGRNIARLIRGEETEPFNYFDKGMMATIGRGAAVVQMPGGQTMKGRMAFLAWGAVHLALLTGGDSRAKAMVDWGWAGVTRERSARVSIDTSERWDELPEPPVADAPRHELRLFWSEADGAYVAEAPAVPDCRATGATYAAALAGVEAALRAAG